MLGWMDSFSAWITINGKEATEYDVQVSEEDRTVTCWIASELGQTFSVNWRNKSHFHDTDGAVKIDGVSCGGKLIRTKHVPYTWEKPGARIDQNTIKPFMFSSLELTDDDALLHDTRRSSLQSLGLIELKISPIKLERSMEAEQPAKPTVLPKLQVHERSKKGVTQQVTLGAPIAALKIKRHHVVRTGPHIVTFYFKYRPLDVLQANGIAPRPPQQKQKARSAPRREQTREEEHADAQRLELLREEMAAIEARMAQTKHKKPRIKRESSDTKENDPKPRKKLKLENGRPFVQGEVIDLT